MSSKLDRSDIPGVEHPDRNRQLERIAELIAHYKSVGDPSFSIDTKAKEHLGLPYRKGRIRGNHSLEAFHHDFPSWVDGVLIPHGIEDPKANPGHINLGLSHDTSEFACDSIKRFWNRYGCKRFPDASSILRTCDGGGSNSANKFIFEYELERLTESIGLPIRLAHYPTCRSKYNLIERRLFPHVERACNGMLIDCLETIVWLMRRAKRCLEPRQGQIRVPLPVSSEPVKRDETQPMK